MHDERKKALQHDYDKMFSRDWGNHDAQNAATDYRAEYVRTTGAHKERLVPYFETSKYADSLIYDPDPRGDYGDTFTPAVVHATGKFRHINRSEIPGIRQRAQERGLPPVTWENALRAPEEKEREEKGEADREQKGEPENRPYLGPGQAALMGAPEPENNLSLTPLGSELLAQNLLAQNPQGKFSILKQFRLKGAEGKVLKPRFRPPIPNGPYQREEKGERESTPAKNPPGIFERFNDKRGYESPQSNLEAFKQQKTFTNTPGVEMSDLKHPTLEDVKQQKVYSLSSGNSAGNSDIEMYSLNALLEREREANAPSLLSPDSPEPPERRIHKIDLSRAAHPGEGVTVEQQAEKGPFFRNAELYRAQMEDEERKAAAAAARKDKKARSNELAAKAQAAIDKAAAAAKAKAKEEEAANKPTKKAAKKPAGPRSVLGGVVQTFLNAVKGNTNFNEAKAEIRRQNSNLN
jgi:hypothetical protein